MVTGNSLSVQKQNARREAKEQRDQIYKDKSSSVALNMGAVLEFIQNIAGMDSKVVAGYWPIGSEFDVEPLLKHLHQAGYKICLPVVIGRNQPLIFRNWIPEMKLESANFNVPIPPSDAGVVSPDIILAPLLAYDNRGYRLGYGGGFYDRTLEKLRNIKQVAAVGLSWSDQYVEIVPTDDYDQPLDALITESFMRVFE